MYGLTRGAITLVGVIVAGFLIWLGVDPLSGESPRTRGVLVGGPHVRPGGARDRLVPGARRLDEVGLAPAFAQRVSLRLRPGADRRWVGPSVCPAGQRAFGRRRARLVERSRNRRSDWRSRDRHPCNRIRAGTRLRPYIRHHGPAGPSGRAGRRGAAARDSSAGRRRPSRSDPRGRPTAALGAIPTDSCSRRRHPLTPVRDRADACLPADKEARTAWTPPRLIPAAGSP